MFAGSATAGRTLLGMVSASYQGFRTAPIPSGWSRQGSGGIYGGMGAQSPISPQLLAVVPGFI